MNGIRIVHRLYPATNVGLVARIPEFVVDDALADPPVEVAQIKCCGAFVCRMSRHWKIVRFWNSDSVGWKLRSEEHTSELQSLMRISYAVFCLKKKQTNT